MVKVAICFFGIIRSLEFVIDSIEDNIFNILKNENYEYDVYIHTYKSTNLPKINNVYKRLNPKDMIIDDQDIFDNEIKDHPLITKTTKLWLRNQKNYIRSTNSIQKVTEMWEKSNINYDVIMLVRPDCMYLNPIQINNIKTIIKSEKIIYIPKFHSNRGYNNRFAMGTPKLMKYFGKQFDWVKEYQKIGHNNIVAEYFISYLINELKNKKILDKLNKNNFLFLRVRTNKTIAKNDQIYINRIVTRDEQKLVINNYKKYQQFLK